MPILPNFQIVPFAHELLEISKPQIVEWNEADYEEYLIERVKRRTDNFVIGLAIDLSPSIRRVRRIRQLLEKVRIKALNSPPFLFSAYSYENLSSAGWNVNNSK